MIWSLMGTLAFHFIVTAFPERNSQCSPKILTKKMFTSRRYDYVAGPYGCFHPDGAGINQLKT